MVAVPNGGGSMVAVPMVALQAHRGNEVEIPRLQAEMLFDRRSPSRGEERYYQTIS